MSSKTLKLNPSGVEFDEAAHTYTLRGKRLRGITDVIRRQVVHEAPYNGPASATEYGKAVHSTIELGDTLGGYGEANGVYDTYRRLIAERGWQVERNEYIVTDGAEFASAIDIVLTDADGGIVLADIKTTSRLHRVKVAWQLSIYRLFFSMLNPELADRGMTLAAVWLPNPERMETPRIETVEAVDESEVKAMLLAETEGREYLPANGGGNTLALADDAIDEVVSIESRLKELADQSRQLRAGLLRLMAEKGVTSFRSDRLLLTRKAAAESVSFDTDRFRADHPDLYAQYCTKRRKTAESLLLKIKDNEE